MTVHSGGMTMLELLHAPAVLVAAPAVTQANAASHIGLPVAGVLCAAGAGVLMWKRRTWRRTQAVLLLVTGLSLAGAAGHIRDHLTALATSASATTTTKVFGVGVSYAVALVIVLWFALDMDVDGLIAKVRKKGGTGGGGNRHTTTGFTPWLALLVVPAVAALPVIGALPATLAASFG